MTFSFRRSYIGKLRGVILDWSGTTLDYGCFAPTVVFVELFAAHGVPISMAQARGPMGKYKRDHIIDILSLPEVNAGWKAANGHAPGEADIQALYDEFIPRQIKNITEYADLIPGVKAAVDGFRARGLKIGSTTGYTRPMMEPLLPEVQKRGYMPDALVCPDEAGGGRPAPWMCFENARRLGIYPMESMVKIGDTLPDIAEGLNAGMWTIGLAKTGNEIGLNEAEIAALAPADLAARLAAVTTRMVEAGAHYVVESLADCAPILDLIDRRLAAGEKP